MLLLKTRSSNSCIKAIEIMEFQNCIHAEINWVTHDLYVSVSKLVVIN